MVWGHRNSRRGDARVANNSAFQKIGVFGNISTNQAALHAFLLRRILELFIMLLPKKHAFWQRNFQVLFSHTCRDHILWFQSRWHRPEPFI